MTDDRRFEQLEQRIATLESLIRQLLANRPAVAEPPSAPVVTESLAEKERKIRAEAAATAATYMDRLAERERAGASPRATPPEPRAAADSEQWLGQRGLLAVGVVFIVLAAGYLLKLSFERGWISPLTRCTGGVLAGVLIGAVGWRLHGRGLKTYGAALIGTGGAIIYLGVWAASRLYGFLPPTTAIAGLGLVSVSLAAIAYAIDIEALGATAVLGAFLAPIVLGQEAGSINALLLYLGSMSAGLGWVSATRHWRIATFLIAISYFGIASSGILNEATTTSLFVYALFGGAAGLYVGLRESWWETRLIAFGGGWAVLGMADEKLVGNHWPTFVGGLVLAAPVWWRAWRSSGIWSTEFFSSETTNRISLGESFYFYLTPWLVGWTLQTALAANAAEYGGLPSLLVGIPYLAVGYNDRRYPFALVGTTALAFAALGQWPGLGAPVTLLLLAHVWAAADHSLSRTDGRWYGLFALGLALAHLVGADLPVRRPEEPAFYGRWALTFWLAVETTTVFAAGLIKTGPVTENLGLPRVGLRAVLWTLGGALLLFGVTGELITLFDQSGLDDQTANLASGLSVSAWWIAFAAGLVLLGFRRALKPVRQAGIFVLGLAVLKVMISDLSYLSALYRVGSVFILGLVSLGLAYLYHRRAATR